MPSVLTAAGRRHPGRHAAYRCLRLWHLCSLDAPTVAVVWAFLLAQQCGLALAATPTVVLLLGTWLVYVLDRLLDAEAHPGAPEHRAHPALASLQDRHRFHHAHRRALLTLSAAAAGALTLLAAHLSPSLLRLYLALALPVAAYAGAVHLPALRPRRPVAGGDPAPQPLGPSAHLRRDSTPGILKEAAVAVLFASAVAAPAAGGALRPQRPALLLSGALFALLCWLNCLLIAHSEAAPGGLPRARRALALGAAALATLAAATGAWCLHQAPAWRAAAPACAAVLLAALALLALLAGPPSPTRARRVRILADLALLTPLLIALA